MGIKTHTYTARFLILSRLAQRPCSQVGKIMSATKGPIRRALAGHGGFDIPGALGNNRALFFAWCRMSVPLSAFSLLLLTTDPDVQAQFTLAFPLATITISSDGQSLPANPPNPPFDAVVIELSADQSHTMTLPACVDPAKTLVIAGSHAVLSQTSKLFQQMNRSNEAMPIGKSRDLSLEDYLDLKMGDFVRGMRNGAAKNLHPMLISAMERPLISSALRETQGNQIQAAELLGLNRNTLRKKITDLHIPLKRKRAKAVHNT